jgi:hypothetical protein
MLQTETKPKVEFEPIVAQSGENWAVRATLPSGKKVDLGCFNNEGEAREWIARKSSAWLTLKGCEGGRYDTPSQK